MTEILVALIIAGAFWLVTFVLAFLMTGGDWEDGVVFATGFTIGLAFIAGVIFGAAFLIQLVTS